MKNVYNLLFIIAVITLLITAPSLDAQIHPVEPNAVWMEETYTANGSSFAYPVFLKNDVKLGKVIVPLHYSHADMILDSISIAGGRLEGMGNTNLFMDNSSRTLYIDFEADPLTPILPDSGVMANLYFSVDQNATTADVIIDSVFIAPDKVFYLEKTDGSPVNAGFGFGLIHIETTTPIIILEPDTFYFSTTEGVDPAPQVLTITNLGEDFLHWKFTYKPTWLNTSVEFGTAPSAVDLMPEVGSLAIGGYHDSIQVTDTLRLNKFRWAFINLEILEGGADLSGIVQDPIAVPIEDAIVEIWDEFPTGSILYSTLSGPDGSFEFETVSPGNYELYCYKDHYYPTTLSITSPDNNLIVTLQPTSDPSPTLNWISLYCDENYLDGNLLPVGSVVEAFDQAGTLCGQFFVHIIGEYGYLDVFLDNPATPGFDEGADSNEVIVMKINGQEAEAYPTPIWSYHGDVQEICLNTINSETVCIDLETGWNLVSWNIDTEDDAIETIIADIISDIDIVLGFEYGAASYDPDLPQFSTLEYLDHLHGYWIKMENPAELCVSGPRVNPRTAIDLEGGWNLVSYLPTEPDSVAHALGSVYADLVVVLGYDQYGLTYDPLQPGLSDLYELTPEYGYWLRMMAPATLIYPGPPLSAGFVYSSSASMKAHPHSPKIRPTPHWVNLYGDGVTFDGTLIPSGSIIEVFDEEGNVCGELEVKVDGMVPFIPVYRDDISTPVDEGANPGDKLSIAVRGIMTNESYLWTSKGDRIELATLTVSEKNETALPDFFELKQNYPNPFNPETVIGFDLSVQSKATMEIFNVLGEKVRTVLDVVLPAGRHQVTWDGTCDNGSYAASGIYFYRLKAGFYSQTKKMILMK